ncbi:NBPF family member NBPF6-like [Callithrix jacchus]
MCLSQELLEAKEQEGPEDSLDEIYSTPSVQRHLSDCHQPYSSASSSLENQLTCPALNVACVAWISISGAMDSCGFCISAGVLPTSGEPQPHSSVLNLEEGVCRRKER